MSEKDNNRNFVSTSISDLLIARVDRIFHKAGFRTRARYIHNRLRLAVERDEKRYGEDDIDGNGKEETIG